MMNGNDYPPNHSDAIMTAEKEQFHEWRSWIPHNEVKIRYVVHYRDFNGDNRGYYCEPVDTIEQAEYIKSVKIAAGKNVDAYIVEEYTIRREAGVPHNTHPCLIQSTHITLDGRISEALHKLESFVRNLKPGTILDGNGDNEFDVNKLLYELNTFRGIRNNERDTLVNLKVTKKHE